ncbi:cobyrinate a,c-diamide synthase|uniref:Cobyrinate a,c-diamide synthase n=1 Tax=Dendrosporobacter quercicolus TaxID=146817 RepID=A0A1G9LIV1_9FIRM|nr:cobyrinate a,c-diamide synthase [Dendrosporobacter quercicolus]NSL46724.1 cobyrinate a,c-diamide synthase [Dendrosporobacter quercicolus DSM 1736]SDL61753.1 cobyrinic acid a,c-diamide synthase [Dendrosporobacter quercicolus]
MHKQNIPRLVIAATSSGAGKTTIVSGVLASLKQAGRTVQAYKVGPDYIDPGYHRLASGKPGHNLDTWLVPPEKLTELFTATAGGNDLVIIEGVMGLYDGGREGVSSTAAIAKLLKAPVVLVIDVKSMGESAAAIALGFKTYDPGVNLAGVIVNRVGSDTHRLMVCQAIEKLGIPVLGCIYRNEELALPERHLGLTPVTEHCAADTLAVISGQIGREVDLERLIRLAETAPALPLPAPVQPAVRAAKVRIGVAEDEAFSFYYKESLAVLAAYGAELISFSPLNDRDLPVVDGLIFGGGFPEMFVERLAANAGLRTAILTAGRTGMPIYAECGGLMYLTESIAGFDGRIFPMVGLVPATSRMGAKLQTVGYIKAAARGDNLLCSAGDVLQGHEFHFSQTIPAASGEAFPWAFDFTKMRTGKTYPGGYASNNILASYLHIHFAGNLRAAEKFVQQCRIFKHSRSGRGE